ncbi:NUDIX domain-containing protein [Kitasatospora sp. NPDC096204]|uniref:NUDIX domain-containing protein n=1 Tax=Kitasatospora sp. NPDC096204 TaxID=3364094 RepID=UPI00382B8E45
MTKPPGRRSGQQAFILREAEGTSQVLLVDPVYMDGFTLPGGSAEANELPHLAARRHTEVETGLVLELRDLLAVDYMPASEFPEGLNLVYAGGMLDARQIGIVDRHQPPAEIRGLHWVSRSEVMSVMQAEQACRALEAWDAWNSGSGLPLLLRGVAAPAA